MFVVTIGMSKPVSTGECKPSETLKAATAVGNEAEICSALWEE